MTLRTAAPPAVPTALPPVAYRTHRRPQSSYSRLASTSRNQPATCQYSCLSLASRLDLSDLPPMQNVLGVFQRAFLIAVLSACSTYPKPF